jgi:hypothetical protein
MLPSDLVGALAAIALAIPACKDQYYRFHRERQQRKAKQSPWPGLREILKEAWETKRAEYDGKDSILLAGGAIGLFVSFALKAFDI